MKMKTILTKLMIIACLIAMTAGCSNQPVVSSVSEDKIVVRANPQDFVTAYHLAQRKCQEDARNADYIPNDADDLKLIAFNCLELETAGAAVETGEEPVAETETTPEAATPQ